MPLALVAMLVRLVLLWARSEILLVEWKLADPAPRLGRKPDRASPETSVS
jgi:hypothetical protein